MKRFSNELPRATFWGWALLALAPACFYSFDNPVSKEAPGSISGSAQLINPAAGQTTAGGTVSVLWSGGYTAPLDSSGRFLFEGLPDGTYTLACNIPPVAANDAPLVALRPDVQLPYVEAEADALNLGAIAVGAAGVVSGVVNDISGPAVVAAFAPIDGGLGVFEGYSTTTDPEGNYTLTLPAGSHTLAASDPTQSDLETVTLQPGESLTQDFGLVSVEGVSSLEGNLVIGLPGFGTQGDPVTVETLLANAQFAAMDAQGNLVADGGLFASALQVDGVGAPFNVVLPSGQVLTVSLTFPPGVSFQTPLENPLVLKGIATVAAQATSLSQVTWLEQALFEDGGLSAGDGGAEGDGGALPDGGAEGDGGLGADGGSMADAGQSDGGLFDAGSAAVFAGNPSASGKADGTLASATFGADVFGLAFGTIGADPTLVVCDSENYEIRAIDLTTDLVSTLAGSDAYGEIDGPADAAEFESPRYAAVNAQGTVFVSDATVLGSNATGCIRAIANGAVTTLTCAAAIQSPAGIAFDAQGVMYLADANADVIYKIVGDAGPVAWVGQANVSGSTDQPPRFDAPSGLAFDSQGNLFVADTVNALIRKITPQGVVTTVAGTPGIPGDADGTPGSFRLPTGVAIDSVGNVLVSDSGNLAIRRITTAGVVQTIAGGPDAGTFFAPQGIALGPGNVLYIGDGSTIKALSYTPGS